jgi:tetratricopeptide (TPR) repeat protein
MIVHVDRSGNMHRRDKAQPVLHPAALHNLLYLLGDVHHLLPLARFKGQVLRVALHLSCGHSSTPSAASASAFILKNVVNEAKRTAAEELCSRAMDQLANGDASLAIDTFRAAIAADPDYFEAHHGLIRALRDAGRLEQSVGAALALTALTPDDPLAHTALSISLQQAGHIPEAEAAAARARILEWKAQLRSPASDQKP